jgi:hypothetical protein
MLKKLTFFFTFVGGSSDQVSPAGAPVGEQAAARTA